MACLGAPTIVGLLVTAVPVLGATGYLLWFWLRAFEKLSYAQSRLLWLSYAAVWLVSSLSTVKLTVELFTNSQVAWDVVSLLHSFGVLTVQACVISVLLHGLLGWGVKANATTASLALISSMAPQLQPQRMTLLVSCGLGLLDAGVRSALLFAAHVPLYFIQGCITTPANVSGHRHLLDIHSNGINQINGQQQHLAGASAGQQQTLDHLPNVLVSLQQLHQQSNPQLYYSGQPYFSADASQGFTILANLGHALYQGMAALVNAMRVAFSSGRHTMAPSMTSLHTTFTRQLLTDASAHIDTSNNNHASAWLWKHPSFASSDCEGYAGWGTWAYLLIYSLVLALIYSALLLFPFTPLRNLLPAKKSMKRYLVACAVMYGLATLGALLAACGYHSGMCIWSLCMWAIDAGYAPLLYVTFLWGVFSGQSGADGLDEDLLYYSEMRDAGVLEDTV